MTNVLAVPVVVLSRDVILPRPPEVEIKVAHRLHLRQIKETGMILGRIITRQVQISLQEQVHQGQAAPRLQTGISGFTQHGSVRKVLVAMSLINSVKVAVSVT